MQLPIKIDELKEAVIRNSKNNECVYYLDTSTGKIIIETREGDPMDIDGKFLYLDGYLIEEYPDKKRFIRLSSNESGNDHHDMQAFISTIHSRWLRNKLEKTIDSYKAFQRVQKILQQETQKYQWSNFRNKQLERSVLQWLKSNGIEIGE